MLICLPPFRASQQQIIDPADFIGSGVQGAGGWHWGFFAQGTTNFSTSSMAFGNSQWSGVEQYSTPIVADAFFHPGESRSCAVRRWVATSSGSAQISGYSLRSNQNGDGVNARILKNGTEIYSRLISNTARADYAINLNIEIGDILEFVVDPLAHFGYDGTMFTGVIALR